MNNKNQFLPTILLFHANIAKIHENLAEIGWNQCFFFKNHFKQIFHFEIFYKTKTKRKFRTTHKALENHKNLPKMWKIEKKNIRYIEFDHHFHLMKISSEIKMNMDRNSNNNWLTNSEQNLISQFYVPIPSKDKQNEFHR